MKNLPKDMTDMQEEVYNWLHDDYPEEERKGAYQDLRQYGCVSGMVSGMVYYTDTLAFFKRHSDEINDLIAEYLSDTGWALSNINMFDKEDPLCLYETNWNLLAWYAFETVAYQLFDEEYGA